MRRGPCADGRSHSDDYVGCIVWSITASSSAESASRSTSAQAGAECLDRLGRIVLAAVETPINERLHAAADQRVDQLADIALQPHPARMVGRELA